MKPKKEKPNKTTENTTGKCVDNVSATVSVGEQYVKLTEVTRETINEVVSKWETNNLFEERKRMFVRTKPNDVKTSRKEWKKQTY